MTNKIKDLPIVFEFAIEILPPSAYYFGPPTRGRLPLVENNYTLIEPPQDLPTYAIANSQDFYLTPFPQYIIPLFLNLPHVFFSAEDSYHEITVVDHLRLDLIAYRYYLNVEFWWIICIANDILDPFNLTIGSIIRIPSNAIVINEWLQRPVKKVRDSDIFFFGTI